MKQLYILTHRLLNEFPHAVNVGECFLGVFDEKYLSNVKTLGTWEYFQIEEFESDICILTYEQAKILVEKYNLDK